MADNDGSGGQKCELEATQAGKQVDATKNGEIRTQHRDYGVHFGCEMF